MRAKGSGLRGSSTAPIESFPKPSALGPQPSRLRSRRGQLVIPALFVIPTLVLFIYLIFETAKVSREKLRRQFALDTAAFVEMANYSNVLNRTAYVNGAFPQRVLFEAFKNSDFSINRRDSNASATIMYDYMRDHGLLPYTDQCESAPDCMQRLGQANNRDWGFKYKDGKGQFGNTMANNKNSPSPPSQKVVDIFPVQFALKHYIGSEMAGAIYKLYAQVFGLLGSVQTAQRSVFERLSTGHAFFVKAYQLNAGERPDSAAQVPTLQLNEAYVESFTFSYVQVRGQDVDIDTMKQPMKFPGNGLFMLGYVSGGSGWNAGKQSIDFKEIKQVWNPGPNFFGVDLRSVLGQPPFVHVTVEVSGGKVWPGATPRYQTKIYP